MPTWRVSMCMCVHTCACVFLKPEALRPLPWRFVLRGKRRKLDFRTILKVKKNYYMSKGVGRLKWLPGGIQNKTVFAVIFQLSPCRENWRRVAIATVGIWQGAAWTPKFCLS